ncbi:zinc-binding dehydrogenase [Natrarchaeobius sp. A-rgal3]|uniref:zinc-dependent alcohol dehydrogenase n=1 Tax=Natrarchaeobius versutus TaxID=1679078 RepID=UPI0035104E16
MQTLAKTARAYGELTLIDRDRPTPASDEALIEVEYAGLCGSDAGIYRFKSAFERMSLPTVIGHEYAGRVVETGESVRSVSPGDRVVERPIRGCGECYQCKIGEENVCQDATITGVDHDGAYAPYIAVPERALQRVDDDIDPRHAALVEPTSIGARAVVENSRIGAGDRVLVAGPGPIGLLTAQIADDQGGEVVVAGVENDASDRLPLAAELGFRTCNVDRGDLETAREELTNGVGYDVVFDTTGHPSGLTMSVEEVRKGGQIVLVGQTGETTMAYSPLVRAEIDLQCSYASTWEDFERSIRLISSGAVDLETILDDRFSLLEADEAFETFLAGETCKPVFDVSVLRE